MEMLFVARRTLMLEHARVKAEAEAYEFRLKMLRFNYEDGERQSLLPAAIAYADHLRSLKSESPLELHQALDTLIQEYASFAKLCVG